MAELDADYLGVDPGSKAELTRVFSGLGRCGAAAPRRRRGCRGSARRSCVSGGARASCGGCEGEGGSAGWFKEPGPRISACGIGRKGCGDHGEVSGFCCASASRGRRCWQAGPTGQRRGVLRAAERRRGRAGMRAERWAARLGRANWAAGSWVGALRGWSGPGERERCAGWAGESRLGRARKGKEGVGREFGWASGLGWIF